jgi:hypothetical protein
MATLGSPGVSVSVIDESFYTPAAPGTTPLIFVATAQDKSNASATGTAQGTTAANAGKVYIITSQRDLTDTFGTPLFYTDASSNPIHGGELNEYGLQAAYSALGVSSRAYVVRADVDLGQLTPSTSIPTGTPVAGTYWIDTDASLYGINEYDASGSNPSGKFTTKTPLIIDNDNITDPLVWDIGNVRPASSFGQQGDYAIVVISQNTNALFYKLANNIWTVVQGGFDSGKKVQVSPHTDYPTWTTSTAVTGSVWLQTTTPGLGANWAVKYYNGSTESWTTVSAPIYNSTRQALEKNDYTGGGKNIPVGTLFVESDYNHYGLNNASAFRVSFKVWRRNSTSPTTVVSGASTTKQSATSQFTIRETLANSSVWGGTKTVNITGSLSNSVASQIPSALSAAGLINVTATFDATTNKVTFKHALGGDFELSDGTSSPLGTIGLSAYNMTTKLGTANLYTAPTQDVFTYLASNWKPLVYEAKTTVPTVLPDDGRLWYDSAVSDVDIMIHNGTTWVGYQNYSSYTGTDPAGPIIGATQPTTQSDGSDLVNGDIWISTADTEMYGKNVYVYDGVATLKWVLQDTADQTTPNGWLFADARWSDNGVDGPTYITSITDLLTSDYVDPDAPDPALYPKGMKLWNLRRSGYNIKKFVKGHLNLEANLGKNIRFGNDNMINPATGAAIYTADRWITVSPNNENGSGKFGRHAQRGYVVSKLKALIDTNAAVRDTDTLVFNLITTPGYPETIANMVAFNTDRGQTAFVIGDTPFRLAPTATALNAWGMNTGLAYDNGDDGAVTYDEYMGMFYPSGYTTDNTGNYIVVPPSHMMLRTIINSDAKSYQWFAPAGTRRGGVDNASSVGYITSEGEFKTAALYEGLRNVLHDVKINPIATLPGVGVVNFGQYTRAKNASALDRINVVRLVAYLRRQLGILAKPYLFEPNDAQTRREIKAAAESLLLELVGQRALYDFVVVCDGTNNTPARIDRSELYMDIAIEPVKAVEFIYIPLRIKNTGEIAAGL